MQIHEHTITFELHFSTYILEVDQFDSLTSTPVNQTSMAFIFPLCETFNLIRVRSSRKSNKVTSSRKKCAVSHDADVMFTKKLYNLHLQTLIVVYKKK